MAEAVGLNASTIRRLERRGIIRAVRDFRGWRAFSPSEIDRLRVLLGWTEGPSDEMPVMKRPDRDGRSFEGSDR